MKESVPYSQPQPREHSNALAVALVVCCTFTLILGNASLAMVSISLPLIAEDLNIPQSRLQWIVTAYSLTAGCFFLLFGRVADLYGRKRLFIAGSIWFVGFSLGCGFAQNDIVLDTLRALTGLSTAATVPSAVGILASAFPPSRARSLAFACFAAGAPLGAVVGQVAAAPLVQFTSVGWRAPFYLVAGLGALVGLSAIFVVDPDPPLQDEEQEDGSIDWIGVILVTTGLIILNFALAQGEAAGYDTPYIIALFVLSPLLLAVFVAWEWWYERHTQRTPLLRTALWTRGHGTFSAIMAITFVEFCGFYAWIYWSTLFYQQLQGETPVNVMVRFLPMCIVGLSLNVVVGLFAARIPLVVLVVVGTLFTGIAALLFAVIDTDATYWAYNFPAAVLSVFGADLVFAPGSIFVAKLALPQEQSVAAGLLQTLVQLGSAFGIAITTVVHDSGVRRALPVGIVIEDYARAPYEAQLRGYRDGFWTCFAFPLFGAVLGALFLRNVGVVGDKSPKRRADVEGVAAHQAGEGMQLESVRGSDGKQEA